MIKGAGMQKVRLINKGPSHESKVCYSNSGRCSSIAKSQPNRGTPEATPDRKAVARGYTAHDLSAIPDRRSREPKFRQWFQRQ